ncbi:MAG: LuxR C-terminal-related transcriptional regulator [Actinomycetota bacterium]|nr:LuxR C-terminal-related transcriptional regulator [Actinomycetota bacterium]
MPRLDRAALNALKSVIDNADDRAAAIPRRALVELAGAVPDGTRVGLDLEAQCTLGVPVVVVSEPPHVDLATFGLTPRELQVARLIAEGLSNKEIARRLMISLGTAKDHVHNVLVKTGASNRTAVVARMRTG